MYDIIQQLKENVYTKSAMVAQTCNISIQAALAGELHQV